MNGLGRTFLIYGASRGLGKAIVNLVPEAQDKIYIYQQLLKWQIEMDI